MTTADPATARPHATRPPPNDYSLLLGQMRSHGLLRRRPAWYVVRIGALLASVCALWWAVREFGDTWWAPAGAVVLAFLSAQAGFLGHDAAHEQAFASHRANAWTAFLLGNLLTGTSSAWWRDEHNRHHRHPNDPDRDPNVAEIVLSLSPERAAVRRGAKRFLAAHQAWLYFPATLLQGANLHHVSIRALRRRELPCRTVPRIAEITGLLLHVLAYTGLLLAALPPGRAVVFAVLHHALWGLYLGATFAPNHKGMPPLTPQDARDPVRRQVVTARNIRGGRFVGFLYGGLNHQIEHHLFPTMPRPALRRAAPLVAEFCHSRGIPYVTETVTGSYVRVLRHLHDVGTELRAGTR
ncbi:fatty acid desaturase family protein [Streptomyces sp. NPDC087440]|uniref:fatty acid desaturase family protein n=1 Tax=Streptomyces sp. NPDC087440 TaxID=3365790 RepID=UPI00380B19B9